MKEARRVVITGASRGLGLEFVLRYLRQGWDVHALLRKPQACEPIQDLLSSSGPKLEATACDVSDGG